MKTYKCKQCNSKIGRSSACYGSGLCRSCGRILMYKKNPDMFKGNNNPNYKKGECLNPRCIDCGKLRHVQAVRCKACENKHHGIIISGKNNRLFGRHRTEETKRKISETKIRNESHKGRKNPQFGKLTHGKGQWYKDYYMRSSWEIKFAKFLDANNIKWLYESKTFDLGNMTYTPDFYLLETDEYIEIKGYWRDDAKYKFYLTKLFYPEVKINLIMKKGMKELQLI